MPNTPTLSSDASISTSTDLIEASPANARLTPTEAAALVPPPTPGEASAPRSLSAPPSRILPDLFLGDHGASIGYQRLVDLGITHILNVKGGARMPRPPFDQQLTLHCVPLSDFGEDDLRSKLTACFAVIDEAHAAGGGCLVHCSQGMNRSPSVVLGYLLLSGRTRWSLHDAWAHVKARRPMVGPHHLYWAQLEAIECEAHGVVVPSIGASDAGIFIPPAVEDELRLRAAAALQDVSSVPESDRAEMFD